MKRLYEKIRFELTEVDRLIPAYSGEKIDVHRVLKLYEDADKQRTPGERRIGAFEATIARNWVTRELLDAFLPSYLYALTDRRLLALKIGRWSDHARRLAFSDSRHSVRVVEHRPPTARYGILRLRRATGKLLTLNYERVWEGQVLSVIAELATGGMPGR